ncbi:aldehyde dehydrogenase (NADP(+)) [Streptomyces halobius]|uniref:Aldehyde dehydrogenase (NADP(+)) n=1 Tax=Streptomyces halobius TaxID=2879846 RepID=A0ABY4MGD2_9ACTN|nr:aldehyde dehydrogenase (NADP(+)) [Streptomyces halobius]UQA96148.1 aldehyde dehydrogenase (NADP(+)) [Streptomyces halobius]
MIRDDVQHIERRTGCGKTGHAPTRPGHTRYGSIRLGSYGRHGIAREECTVAAEAAPVWSVDPRTGKPREQVAVESTAAEVDAAVRTAHAAFAPLADRTVRATFLRRAAGLLDEAGEAVIEAADAETALGPGRLTGELARTTYQLRAFADGVTEGAFLDVRIDHADPDRTPPRPDLRRYKIPLGTVAVYAASNFPLAFSVPGGDTASALAAGCPVVVKAHPDHPATSELCAALLRRAATDVGLPEGVVNLVHGFQAGIDLVRHPLISAAGFTGSVRGGRALYDAAAARPHPIPFHGELGSLNPVVVTEAAAAERAEQLGTGLAASMTLGVGQFCVKPGLVLAPAGDTGDRLLKSLTAAVSDTEPGVLLDHRMRDAFLDGVRTRAELPDVQAPVTPGAGGEHTVSAGFLTVPAARLATEGPHDLLLEECFGPVTVLARYTDESEIGAVLARLSGNLTATLHLGDAESAGTDAAVGTESAATGDVAGDAGDAGDGGDGVGLGARGAADSNDGIGLGARLLSALTPLAGRIVVNGWPTGVAVAPAQHHGGPYPATTSTSTSVGGTAVERWLRPVVYQDTPPALLPPELREDNPPPGGTSRRQPGDFGRGDPHLASLGLPRRVDGRAEGA